MLPRFVVVVVVGDKSQEKIIRFHLKRPNVIRRWCTPMNTLAVVLVFGSIDYFRAQRDDCVDYPYPPAMPFPAHELALYVDSVGCPPQNLLYSDSMSPVQHCIAVALPTMLSVSFVSVNNKFELDLECTKKRWVNLCSKYLDGSSPFIRRMPSQFDAFLLFNLMLFVYNLDDN